MGLFVCKIGTAPPFFFNLKKSVLVDILKFFSEVINVRSEKNGKC